MGEGRTSSSRVSVYEAAEVMGVTVDAIRKRISRDTVPHERDEDGRVWVLLDTNQDAAGKVQDTDQPQSDSDALISQMQARIDSLERQLEQANERDRENRRLLAAALERVPPQLEAPESPETAREAPEEEPHSATGGAQADAQGAQSEARRPWWRRMLGG